MMMLLFHLRPRAGRVVAVLLLLSHPEREVKMLLEMNQKVHTRRRVTTK